MKKLFFFMTLLFASTTMFAETASIDLSAQGYENAAEISSVAIDANVAATFDKGTNTNTPKYYTSGTSVRLYGGSTLTISSTAGPITAINFTFGGSDKTNTISVDTGTLTDGAWTGESSTVVFTIDDTSGHRRFQAIEVTYSAGTEEPVAEPLSFDFQGGIAADFGWSTEQDMYNSLTAIADEIRGSGRVWLTLEQMRADGFDFSGNTFAGGIYYSDSKLDVFLANETFKTQFTWMIEYLDVKASEGGKAKPSEDWAAFRWNPTGFFANHIPTGKYTTVDYSVCGVSSNLWVPYFNFYTVPTKAGYEFTGWYETADCTGEALTVLPTSGTIYAGWKVLPLEFDFQGGVAADFGWSTEQDMYNSLTAIADEIRGSGRVWLTLEQMRADGFDFSGNTFAGGIYYSDSKLDVFLANETFKTQFTWMIEYLDVKASEGGKAKPSEDWAAFRWNPTGFFANHIPTGKYTTVDYSVCGVSSNLWVPYFNFYTVPTKAGYEFTGWYETADCTGEALTALPAGGTLYAGWEKLVPTAIKIAAPESTVVESEATLQLTATVEPADVLDAEVVWTSGDATLATVSEAGLVTSLVTAEDTTVYIFAAVEGYDAIKDSVQLTLKKAAAPQPTEMWLTPGWGEIIAGGEMFAVTVNFDVEVSEEDLVANLTWSTDREGVMVMGLNEAMIYVPADAAEGQLVVTATYGELEAYGYYTIMPAGPQGISITPFLDLEIASEGTLQLEAMLYPEDAEATVVWSSSDETLATVSEDGLVTSLYTATDKDTTVQIFAAAEGFEGIKTHVDVKLLAAEKKGVTFELNGGVAVELPAADNEALWALFMPDYCEYYGLIRPDQPITGVAAFVGAKVKDILTDPESPWSWLGAYMISVVPALAEADEAAWVFSTQGFFNALAAGSHIEQLGDWTVAGQTETWQAAYQFMVAPTKEDYEFTGWYSDEACTELATELPETGTLYAGWKAKGTTGLENTEAGQLEVRKVLRNGQVIIIRGEEEYTIMGTKLQ